MPLKPPLRIPRAPSNPKFPTSSPQLATRAASRAAPPKFSPRLTSSSPPPPPPPQNSYRLSFREALRYGGIAIYTLCGVLFVRDHLVSFDKVNGPSMAPTLSPHAHETGQIDRIVLQRNIRYGNSIQRGDVVTFWKPHRPTEISIKRVIALEGDTVYPHRGYALDPEVVNSKRVEGGWDGLGNKDADAVGGEEVEVGKVVVPRGHLWVEGDNWRRSYDSCDFGPVSLGLVDGKAIRIWRRWSGLDMVGDGRKKEKGHWTRVVKGDRGSTNDMGVYP